MDGVRNGTGRGSLTPSYSVMKANAAAGRVDDCDSP